MSAKSEHTYTVATAARELSVGQETIRRAIRRGDLKARRLEYLRAGRPYVILASDLAAFVAGEEK